MASSSKCQHICAILLLIFGLCFIILAVVGRSPLNQFIDNMIKKQVVLAPGTLTFDNWSKPPVTVYDDIFMFNITNPELFKNGSKAQLEVIGPFVYRKDVIKANANVTGDLKYAFYYDEQHFHFDEHQTRLKNNKTKISDTVFLPNVPLLAVSAQIAGVNLLPPYVKDALEEIISTFEQTKNISAVLNGTVHDVLWGMDDPIMSLLYKFQLAPFPKFALQVNGSTDPVAMTDPTYVYTGHTDYHKVAQYHRFHGRNSSGCWASHAANVINGTEGTMFAPLLNKSNPLTIYNEQLFRSLDLYYTKESSYNGVKCYVYKIPDWALQNVTNNPSNAGYYAYTYSGMLNLTKCASSVPLYVTKAMFLDADERLLNNISLNISPNSSLHDTYLCVEPNTGVPIDAHKRVQVNVEVRNYNVSSLLEHVRHAFVPLVYVDEHGSITPDLTKTLKDSLLTPILAIHVMFYVLCSLGTVFVLCSVLIHVKYLIDKYRNSGGGSDSLLKNEETPENEAENPESDQYLSFDGRTSRYYDPVS